MAKRNSLGQKPLSTIYEVFCAGQYFATVNGQTVLRNYEISFLGDDSARRKGFLSSFRQALTVRDGVESIILKKMKHKYPDYKRFRTHMIDKVLNKTDQNKPVKELDLMNRRQIVRFIDTRGLPIDSDLYPSPSDLRQALKDYKTSPENFEKLQEKRRLIHGPDLLVKKTLEQLNAFDLPPGVESEYENNQTTAPTQQDGSTDYTPSKNDGLLTPEGQPVQEDWLPEEDDDTSGIPMFDDDDELAELVKGI